MKTGDTLGPYRVLEKLGAGGMGEVYKANDTRLDRIVALKMLPEALAADPEFCERFAREAKSISALSHPNICTLFDVGSTPSTSSGQAGSADGAGSPHVDYLVMEYLEGETLAARLERGALPLADALRTATEIASALDKAHRQGIVHRDLKPGNIMLVKSGGARSGQTQAKLLDFGLAKIGPAGALSGVAPTGLVTSPRPAGQPLTAQGTILGTFQYMAPEQIDGEEADARTDIFAFGAVLFEMLTGRRAFAARARRACSARFSRSSSRRSARWRRWRRPRSTTWSACAWRRTPTRGSRPPTTCCCSSSGSRKAAARPAWSRRSSRGASVAPSRCSPARRSDSPRSPPRAPGS
jgi:serine/threonine protein kinase